MVECSRVKWDQVEPWYNVVELSRIKQSQSEACYIVCSRVKWCQEEPSRAKVQCSGVE